MVGSAYPLTQVYQHAEDRERGDLTLSLLLGTRGTFAFSALGFLFVGIWLLYGTLAFSLFRFTVFLALGWIPALTYFGIWCLRTRSQPATFDEAMWMSLLSATGTNLAALFFLIGDYFLP
jgi:1,4-dihydroxy-2-naphthoate octaprenyltransferase